MRNSALQRLTLTAVLASFSAILKIVFQMTTLAEFRFSLYEIPLIIVGMVLGPWAGLVAGFSADWVYATVFGYGLNLMTVTTMMWGFIAGLFFYKRSFTKVRLVLFLFTAAIVAFSINTIQLTIWYSWFATLGNMPIRIAIMFISFPIQLYLIHTITHRVVKHTNLDWMFVPFIPANEKQ